MMPYDEFTILYKNEQIYVATGFELAKQGFIHNEHGAEILEYAPDPFTLKFLAESDDDHENPKASYTHKTAPLELQAQIWEKICKRYYERKNER